MSRPRPIVLVGMMLSGKTTVGSQLARELGCPFIDLDEVIVERAGRSIADIFAGDGEPVFRRLEAEALADELTRHGPRVVATGGGAILDPRSRRLMRERGFVVYLECDPSALAARRTGPSGRPLLDTQADAEGTLAELLEARRDYYLEVQHYRVRADRLEVGALTAAILKAHEANAHS